MTTSLTIGQIVQRFLGRLRFPQLFVVAAILFGLDFFIPDMVPFLDEVMLAVLTVLLGQWKKPEATTTPVDHHAKPPPKNVTPPS